MEQKNPRLNIVFIFLWLFNNTSNSHFNTLSNQLILIQTFISKILGGYLSLKLGAKLVLAGSILIGSILTLVIPVAANLSYIALFVCRFFTGVAHVNYIH